jgi:multidrug efflux system outer membrane protein
MYKYTHFIILFFALQGCAYIPSLNTESTVIPDLYPESEIVTNNDESLPDWQNLYRDETLKTMIAIGLENNRDLKSAALNIEQSRALYDIQAVEKYPNIDATGSYSRQRNPQNTGSAVGDYYTVGLGLTSYELDLFGRIESLSEAALNDYFETLAAQRTIQNALIAGIARTYIMFKADEALLDVTNQTIESRAKAHDLSQIRLNEGIGTQLDVSNTNALLEQARGDQYQYIAAIEKGQNALRFLLGTPRVMPDTGDIMALEDLDNIVTQIPVGLPSSLMTERPDIIQAEYALKSANADIGAARAAFFPTVKLTATAGYVAPELNDLFDSGSQAWQFAPQITVPIFRWGSLKRQLDLASLRKEQAIVTYEQSIEMAFREVVDALSDVKQYSSQLGNTEKVITSNENA